MPTYINDIDNLPAGMSFEDTKPGKTDLTILSKYTNFDEIDFEDIDFLKMCAKHLGVNIPINNKVSFNQASEALDPINEAIIRQTLKQDLVYSSIEEFLNKQEVLNKILRLNTEKLLDTYSELGFIDGVDNIVIPKGTQFTWKKAVDYLNDTYDIYYVKGNKYALIAINTRDTLDVFEDNI